jgi:hypothetical protein
VLYFARISAKLNLFLGRAQDQHRVSTKTAGTFAEPFSPRTGELAVSYIGHRAHIRDCLLA